MPSITDASALNKVQDSSSSPFHNMWEPKLVSVSKKIAKVPKHFYKNYRLNMVSQAEEIASALMNQTQDLIHTCGDCDDCMCADFDPAKLEEKIKQTKAQMSQRRRSKVKEMYNPYVPCRRCCSTLHNPRQHTARLGKEHIDRLH